MNRLQMKINTRLLLTFPLLAILATASAQEVDGLAFDGVDLMPFIAGDRPSGERPHDVLYWRRDDDYAIRKGDWKLTWNDASSPQRLGRRGRPDRTEEPMRW